MTRLYPLYNAQTVPSVAMQSAFQPVELLQAQMRTFSECTSLRFSWKTKLTVRYFCAMYSSQCYRHWLLHCTVCCCHYSVLRNTKLFPTFAKTLNVLSSYSLWSILRTLQQAYQKTQWIIQNLFRRLFYFHLLHFAQHFFLFSKVRTSCVAHSITYRLLLLLLLLSLRY